MSVLKCPSIYLEASISNFTKAMFFKSFCLIFVFVVKYKTKKLTFYYDVRYDDDDRKNSRLQL